MILSETIERDGHTLDVLLNSAGTLRLMVSRKGAEPISLARKNSADEWIGFLVRDGDVSKNPQGWNNHSTVMGYYIHRILNEETDYNGHPVKGGTHSFLRHKTFAAPQAGESAVSYHLPSSDIQPEEYPYRVDFTLTYELTENELVVTFFFENHEENAVHVSFGLHPGFAVTSLADAVIQLPPGKYLRHFAPGNFLSGETQEIDFAGGPMPFTLWELPGSFLLDLENVPNRVFTVDDPLSGRYTTLDFGDVPYLTLWSDGAAFICVEPCWGLPDHQEQRPFAEKLGMQIIPPRSSLSRSFSIKPEISEISL